MVRPFRQQIDEGILDRAAALFARHGFEHTSLQAVADAVGLSKAGLLHHFPSKDALHSAVLALGATLAERVLDSVQTLPPGPARDERALDALTDVALAHPGVVALLLAPATQAGTDEHPADTDGAAGTAFAVFGVDLETTEPERVVRVIGALSALAVLSLAAQQNDQTTGWRPFIVATCLDALGSRRAGTPTDLFQAEA